MVIRSLVLSATTLGLLLTAPIGSATAANGRACEPSAEVTGVARVAPASSQVMTTRKMTVTRVGNLYRASVSIKAKVSASGSYVVTATVDRCDGKGSVSASATVTAEGLGKEKRTAVASAASKTAALQTATTRATKAAQKAAEKESRQDLVADARAAGRKALLAGA